MIYVACSLNLQISICSMLWIPLCSFRGLCWVRPLTLHHRLWSTSLSTSPPQSWTTPRPKQFVTIYHFHQLSSDIRSSVTLFLSTFSSHRRIVNSAAAQRHSLLIRRVMAEQAGKNRARQDWTGQSRTAFIKLKKKQHKNPTKKPPPKPKKPQPNPEPGPQPIFRIRKVLSHFPVSVWLEPSLSRCLGSHSSAAA